MFAQPISTHLCIQWETVDSSLLGIQLRDPQSTPLIGTRSTHTHILDVRGSQKYVCEWFHSANSLYSQPRHAPGDQTLLAQLVDLTIGGPLVGGVDGGVAVHVSAVLVLEAVHAVALQQTTEQMLIIWGAEEHCAGCHWRARKGCPSIWNTLRKMTFPQLSFVCLC